MLPKSKRCRPCNFKHRKTTNKGTLSFKCACCGNTFLRVDRGDAYNYKRKFCSENCHKSEISGVKSRNKVTRKQHTLARNRARAYMSKFGIKSGEAPEVFKILIKSYEAKAMLGSLN